MSSNFSKGSGFFEFAPRVILCKMMMENERTTFALGLSPHFFINETCSQVDKLRFSHSFNRSQTFHKVFQLTRKFTSIHQPLVEPSNPRTFSSLIKSFNSQSNLVPLIFRSARGEKDFHGIRRTRARVNKNYSIANEEKNARKNHGCQHD